MLFGAAHGDKTASVIRGVLDLRDETRTEFVIDLNGEWRFYWNRPESIDSLATLEPDGYFSIPGYWQGHVLKGEKLPGFGYATYALTVYVPPDFIGLPLTLQTPDQQASYTVWADGKKISSSGTAGTTRQTTTSGVNMHIASFTPQTERVELVMRVSNFIAGGGPHHALSLGTHSTLLNRFAVRHGLDLLFLGAMLLAGLYHLSLYSLQKEMRSYLYFALFALFWALRFFIEGMYTRPITFIFPNLPYEIVSRLELITAVPTSWLLLVFVYSLFPAEQKRGWLRFAFWSSMLLLTASFVLPIGHLIILFLAFQLLSFILIFPFYATLVAAIRSRRDGAWLVFMGAAIFTLAAVNDTLYSMRIINTAYLISAGIVLQTLFFSATLSSRFAHAYLWAKKLTRELDEKNRALKQLDCLKDEFIANTSHELRTPLQGIVGLAEGLAHSASEEIASGLSLIAASGRRLAHLINDIQDFSRIKNKELNLSMRPVDIRSRISTVLALAYHLRRSDTVSMHNNLPDDFPLVHGDEERLEQVFYNLIGNAVKYTTAGRITIDGHVADGMAVIRVEDTGAGIRQEKLETLFLPYEQAADGAEQQAGTGIGLSITKHLVDLHGGSIGVQSRYGEGSCFTVALPLAPAGSECEHAAPLLNSVLPDVTLEGVPSLQNMPEKMAGTILVVDDDPVNRRVFTTILDARYTAVLEASDGVEALEFIEKYPPDLVLLDIMMPRLDGYATLKKIRERFSALELPVLILTARNRSIDLVTGFNAGANDYLTKPCGTEELLARVESQMQVGRVAALQQENQMLTGVIKTERRLQQQSMAILERLESMLDALSDPVVLVDETHTVAYANAAFCSIAKIDCGAIVGTSINSIIDDPAIGPSLNNVFGGNSSDIEGAVLCTNIADQNYSLALRAIGAGDELLVMISPADTDAASDYATDIQVSYEGETAENRRLYAMTAITEAVRSWEDGTGLSALELARQSGLWKIHVNPDGWQRAKTLDRYLSKKDFPKNPRMKTIAATLAFVLERLGPQSPDYSRLHELFDVLRQWV